MQQSSKVQRKTLSRWSILTPEEASGRKVLLSAKREAVAVYTKYLNLSEDQQEKMTLLYDNGLITDIKFRNLDEKDQLEATTMLGINHLDLDARERPDSRWSIKWSKGSGRGEGETRRVLYQCDCGYDHIRAGSKKRHNPVNFTGCLAHAEVTYLVQTQHILRIRGHFEHNQGCQDTVLARFPPIPLHPSVYQMALTQLRAGAMLADIHDKNRTLIQSPEFMNQFSAHDRETHRWLLRATDTRSLYRQYNRMEGIKVTEPAHINVHEWLDPLSSQYNPILADAIFYYHGRANKEERFEACIATKDMRDATWKYAHKSQIILDGTFGICDKKILLFIIMGIDENRHGVPLAFLFFSAPSQSRHTASGYNINIITKLLQVWQDTMGCQDGVEFDVAVAITDTDLKERAALVAVFPRIWLLICKFHLRQSWRNHRNKILKGTTPAYLDVKNRLRRVEESLVHTRTIIEAKEIIANEVAAMETMRDAGENVAVAEKAIMHLTDYLLGYWTTETLWQSWSDFGRQVAASVLNCPFEGVLPTTNHLESFNGLLKRKYLRRWQHGGRRLRLDVLLKLLVTKVLPSIFQHRAITKQDAQHWEAQIRKMPGGDALLAHHDKPISIYTIAPMAYIVPDEVRDDAATQMLLNKQISVPHLGSNGLTFKCFSSLAIPFEKQPISYEIFLGLNGTADCSCKDFCRSGGACKHMRLALLRLEELHKTHPQLHLPTIQLPTSLQEAQTLRSYQLSQLFAPPKNCAPLRQNPIQCAATCVADALQEADDIYIGEDNNSNDENAAKDYSDMESVGTDDANDHEFEFSGILGTPQASINDHAISRTFYDFERAIPKLAEWRQYLEAVSELRNPQDRERAAHFHSELTALSNQLTRLISGFDKEGIKEKEPPAAEVTPTPRPLTQPTKCPHASIIGPSPEKASKRRKSYGYH